jgi:hypothetical protein
MTHSVLLGFAKLCFDALYGFESKFHTSFTRDDQLGFAHRSVSVACPCARVLVFESSTETVDAGSYIDSSASAWYPESRNAINIMTEHLRSRYRCLLNASMIACMRDDIHLLSAFRFPRHIDRNLTLSASRIVSSSLYI